VIKIVQIGSELTTHLGGTVRKWYSKWILITAHTTHIIQHNSDSVCQYESLITCSQDQAAKRPKCNQAHRNCHTSHQNARPQYCIRRCIQTLL